MTKTFLLILIFITLSLLVYNWIASLPDVATISEPDIKVTVATGEKLFWGRATCHVCHRIGEKGYALRGPNLGKGEQGAALPLRAQQRAEAAGLPSGLDYIVQSIAEPGAYIVTGFNDEMPKVYEPPVSLYPSEIKAIVKYLSGLAGDSLTSDFRLPDKLYEAYRKPKGDAFVLRGDADAGRKLFFDAAGPAGCASCHIATDVDGQPTGNDAGPDLRAIATFRTPAHLYQKIIRPDSNIVSGYQEVLVQTLDGRFIIGTIEAEQQDTLTLQDSMQRTIAVARAQIVRMAPQRTSSMPGNYRDLLTEQQLQGLVAFLATQTDMSALSP